MTTQEAVLWAAYRLDRSTKNRNALVEHYLPYADGLAKYYRGSVVALRREDIGDVRSDVYLGLIKLVEREDIRPHTFKTFIGHSLRFAVKEGARTRRLSRRKTPYSRAVTLDTGLANALVAPDPDETKAESDDRTEFLMRGINAEDRELARLYLSQGLKQREIAERLGTSQPYVSIKLREILKIIRSNCQQYQWN